MERVCLEKVWGGRALERQLGIALPGSGPIGETWELADRKEHISTIAAGPLAGVRLDELMRVRRAELLGLSRPALGERFPLLIKFLDAQDALSIQVHPHAQTRRAGEETKTECWYILEAQPGARLYFGLKAGVTREHLAAHAGKSSILDCIESFAVQAGQFVFVPAGTVHAIGAGITLIEIQENADTTYRLYDWDRPGLDGKPRALQIEDALRVTRFTTPAPRGPFLPDLGPANQGQRSTQLCAADEFSVELHELHQTEVPWQLPRAQVVLLLEGSAELKGHFGREALQVGNLVLLPGSLAACTLTTNHHARLLRAIAS